MAQQKRRTSGKRSPQKKPTQPRKTKAEAEVSENLRTEIILLISLAVSILLLISNLGIGGFIGGKVSGIFFGIFGVTAYLFPFVLFIGTAFYISNKKSWLGRRKMAGGIVCFIFLCAFLQLITAGVMKTGSILYFYRYSAKNHLGGGILGGVLTKLLAICFGTAGTYVIVIAVLVISVIIMTQRPILAPLSEKSSKLVHNARDEVGRRRQERSERRMHRKQEGQPITVDLNLEQQTAKPKRGKKEELLEIETEIPEFPVDPMAAPVPDLAELHIVRSEPQSSVEETEIQPVKKENRRQETAEISQVKPSEEKEKSGFFKRRDGNRNSEYTE